MLATLTVTTGLPTVAATAAPTTITISGHVSLGDSSRSAGLNEVGVSYRLWQPQWFTTSVLTKTDAAGNYSISVQAPAILALNFDFLGTGSYVSGTTSSSTWPGDPALLYTADTAGVDYTLVAGGVISGTITDTSGVLQNGVTAIAHATSPATDDSQYSAVSDVNGRYSIVNLPAGNYRVEFFDGRMIGPGSTVQPFFRQWWQGTAANSEGAPPFSLALAEVRDGVDAALFRGAQEEVRVTCELCTSSSVWNVEIYYSLELKLDGGDWVRVRFASSTLPGVYQNFVGLYPGTYRLRVQINDSRFDLVVGPQFTLNELGKHYDAITVPTAVGHHGSISGTVTAGGAAGSVQVLAYRYDNGSAGWGFAGSSYADPATGNYSIGALQTGTYTVYFHDESETYVGEWYNDKRVMLAANSFEVDGSSNTANINATLTSDGPIANTTRIAGADRFETSARIAQSFTSTGGVVYVANGTGYADALSAAPAAARWDAPLLLTQRDLLPNSIRDQIIRLKPNRIVVVGGTGVISDYVFQVLEGLSSGTTERIGGANRYETSRRIAADAFGTLGGAYAFVATGTGFPDALSAAAAANQWHAPVILIDGTKSALDPATKKLLTDLGLYQVFIAGGVGVVSQGIEDDLDSLGFQLPTERLGGANRYETSYLINQRFFGLADYAYFATGAGFADALSGAALAAHNHGPLYLVPTICVPENVLGHIDELNVDLVTLLGGTGVLTTAVEQLHAC